MADTIEVQTGTKIRQNGKTYKVADPSEVNVDLIEVPQTQKNPWKAFMCQNPECKQVTGSVPRQVFRVYRAKFDRDMAQHPDDLSLPRCGTCYEVMTWKAEKDLS
jgi:hypothetical protein